jgi:hypothetical protein
MVRRGSTVRVRQRALQKACIAGRDRLRERRLDDRGEAKLLFVLVRADLVHLGARLEEADEPAVLREALREITRKPM